MRVEETRSSASARSGSTGSRRATRSTAPRPTRPPERIANCSPVIIASPPRLRGSPGTGGAACRWPCAASRSAWRRTPTGAATRITWPTGVRYGSTYVPDSASTTSTLALITVTHRAVARGLARSASTCRRARTSARDRLSEAFEDARQPGSAAAGAQDQVRGDQVAGGVVEFVGECAERLLGVPPCPEPGHEPLTSSADRRGCRSQRRDQCLLEADPDGEHPGERASPFLHRFEPGDLSRGRRGGRAGPAVR